MGRRTSSRSRRQSVLPLPGDTNRLWIKLIAEHFQVPFRNFDQMNSPTFPELQGFSNTNGSRVAAVGAPC